jgi:Tfp pilus assembly protein PilV
LAGPADEYRVIHRLRRAEAGFSLVEVMVAATVLVIGVLGTVSMVDAASNTTSKNNRREIATATARDVVEAVRGLPYASIMNGTAQAEVQAQAGLADGDPASGWQIKRSNVQFTVALEACALDDANDGAGSHDPTISGAFCSDAIPAGTADKKPNDFSRVRLTVSWKTPRGSTDSVTQSSIVNNTYRGPKVTGISPPDLAINTNTSSPVAFTATTAPAAYLIEWYVDGKYRGSGSSLSWKIGTAYGGSPCPPPPSNGPGSANLIDGTYQIGAQGFDRANTTFGPTYVSARLNRCRATAVTGLHGGRTYAANHIELEWHPNIEDDIRGYYVYRSLNGVDYSKDVVSGTCAGLIAGRTNCYDIDSPAIAGQTVYYKLVAVDLSDVDNPGSLREGDVMATGLAVTTTNNAPGTPVIHDALSAGTISWAPVSDPDPGDKVDFYRVYRDGVLKDTYASTSAASIVWTDPDTGGVTHSYYVTAVDTHLRPSANSNTVTR